MKILHTHNQDINTFHSYVEIGTINAVQKTDHGGHWNLIYLPFCCAG